jgi:hypothetical protein
MKCPADIVTACDKEPECNGCGFCLEHCICQCVADDWSDEEEAEAHRG